VLVLVLVLVLGAFEHEHGAPEPNRMLSSAHVAVAASEKSSAIVVAAGRAKLARSFDAFLARVPVKRSLAPGAERALAELSRARHSRDAVALRTALEPILRTSTEAAHELARALSRLGPEDAPIAFATSLALAPWVDAEAARTLLESLSRKNNPEVRPTLVLALRGSSEPRVDVGLVELYEADSDPAVRSAAAFALADRLGRLDPALAGRARAQAWRDLEQGDPRAGGDVLGAGELLEPERERLGRLAASPSAEPARRVSALRALAAAGASRGELGPLLDAIADEPGGAPGEVGAVAAMWRRRGSTRD
jgi:hypothetical protein